jgi:hypothetical protein
VHQVGDKSYTMMHGQPIVKKKNNKNKKIKKHHNIKM